MMIILSLLPHTASLELRALLSDLELRLLGGKESDQSDQRGLDAGLPPGPEVLS